MPRTPNANRETTVTGHKPVGQQLAEFNRANELVEAPPPRGTWGEETVDAWDSYWSGDISKAVRGVDTVIVYRYFDIIEMASRIFEEMIDADLLNENSRGDVTAHPLLVVYTAYMRTAIQLANQIGATPLARLKLGITALEQESTKYALERALGGSNVKPAEVTDRTDDDTTEY